MGSSVTGLGLVRRRQDHEIQGLYKVAFGGVYGATIVGFGACNAIARTYFYCDLSHFLGPD